MRSVEPCLPAVSAALLHGRQVATSPSHRGLKEKSAPAVARGDQPPPTLREWLNSKSVNETLLFSSERVLCLGYHGKE